MAPSPFSGESREVDAGSCFDWLRQGWAMFLVNPGIWIGVTVLLLVILMAISIVPLFGQIAAHLLVPLFGAGMFRVCRRMSNNEEPEISDLFAGFHHQAGQLVMVGVFFAAGIFGIAFLAFLLVSGGMLGGVITGRIAGLSIALGAFTAGLFVSSSYYSHRVLSEVLPFKDLFLTIFFVSAGLLIDIDGLWEHIGQVATFASFVLAIKFVACQIGRAHV